MSQFNNRNNPIVIYDSPIIISNDPPNTFNNPIISSNDPSNTFDNPIIITGDDELVSFHYPYPAVDNSHVVFLSIPNEILYQIASNLPASSLSALQGTCRAMYFPLREHMLDTHTDDVLLYAADTGNLRLATAALNAGADPAYTGKLVNGFNMYNHSTALHIAASKGYSAIIVELLHDREVNTEARNGNNETALLLAARFGHQKCVDILIDAGSDTDALGPRKSTLLLAAITSGLETTAMRYLHQMDEIAFRKAITFRRIRIATEMLFRGIADTITLPLGVAAAAGLEYVKLCLSYGAKVNMVLNPGMCTPLSSAVAAGRMDVVDYLLSLGANINLGPKKYRPIMNAVQYNRIDMVRLLISRGVDLGVLRHSRADVLSAASVSCSAPLVTLLLDAGQHLDVNGFEKDPKKQGPLHFAAEHGNSDVIRLLFKRGAKINYRRGPKRETALHWAARAGMVSAIEALLACGADPKLKCNGSTPLLMANRCWADMEQRGNTMAALVRGGADIGQLGSKSRALVVGVLGGRIEKVKKTKGVKVVVAKEKMAG